MKRELRLYGKHEIRARMLELGFSQENIDFVLEGDEPHQALILIEWAEAYLDGENPFPTEWDFPLTARIDNFLNQITE